MSLWSLRLAKAIWARDNPDKVRAANQRWRAGREEKHRRQARERMRRLRARRKRSQAQSLPRVTQAA